MFIVTIRGTEERRSRKDRRKASMAGPSAGQRQGGIGRRKVADRRGSADRRKGVSYELPDNQKPAIDRIIRILEKGASEKENTVLHHPPLRDANTIRPAEGVRIALNVLYSKKCGGGFNQLDVFADPARSLYIIRNRATGLEAGIPSQWLAKEERSSLDKEAREKEIVKAFRKLGKPCNP
jgi:hypothetical protein